MDRRSEAIAQLLETALSERFLAPVTEVIQAIPIPVAIVLAGDLRVFSLNDRMAKLFNRPAAEAVGRPIVDLTPSAHPLSDPGPYRHVAGTGRPYESSLVLGRQPWQWFIQPLKGADHSVDHLLVGLIARTDRQADWELERLLEVNAVKSEFLNLAAHELRTPLGVIHGYASLLAQGGLSTEHQHLAGVRIYEKAKQLSRLITDLSLVARLDELGPALHTDELDLVKLLEPVVEELQRRFPDLAIDFQFVQPTATVVGNADWLRLALRELLDNAVRFRPGPSGRIDISITPIARAWVVRVADDGFGIPTADQGRLFERFSRIETDENQHLVGMGIGLFTVREVARAHQGRISVKSQAGSGSEFSFELPASGTSAPNR